MKIFALNLCLTFVGASKENPYQFQPISFSDLAAELSQAKGDFQRQMYLSFEPTSANVEALFSFQSMESVRALPYTLVLICEDEATCQRAIQAYQSKFTPKVAAGGLVQNEHGAFLCIQHEGKWTLPKGHLEKEESPETAAIREVKEETGIIEVTLGSPLPTTYHTYFRKHKWHLKTTYWYRMEAPADQKLTPQTAEQIEAVAWKSQAEWMAIATQSYPSIRQLFETAFASSLY